MDDNQAFTFISYAQNGEDVVLNRGFSGQKNGFFVDVGAGDPHRDSVTKNLVDRSLWRGINIEPVPDVYERLKEARKADINLCVAVGTRPGTATFYRLRDKGALRHGVDMSTLDSSLAQRHAKAGWIVEEIDVTVVTLESILSRNARPGFDLLKIDVEGREEDVLESFDIRRWRPRVMIIEAVVPGTPEKSHHRWEPRVLTAGYRLALFDGLNRFYVRNDEEALLERMSAPANVFDRWIPAKFARCIEGMATPPGGDCDS